MTAKILLPLALALFLMVLPAVAGDYENETFEFPADDVERLDINIELGAGTFFIQPEETDVLAKAEVKYQPDVVRIFGDYDRRGKTGYIDFKSSFRTRTLHVEGSPNDWDITLSTKYPVELTLDLGAAETDVELGGIPIEEFELNIGATEGRIAFSSPNPIRTDDVTIDAGAAAVNFERLGNLNFRRLDFEGGMGDFTLDFRGEYKDKSRAKISIGMGSATIYVPSDLPVRIDADDNFMASIDFDNAERKFLDDDYYETDDYRDSDIGLALEIEVGLGSIEIIFED